MPGLDNDIQITTEAATRGPDCFEVGKVQRGPIRTSQRRRQKSPRCRNNNNNKPVHKHTNKSDNCNDLTSVNISDFNSSTSTPAVREILKSPKCENNSSSDSDSDTNNMDVERLLMRTWLVKEVDKGQISGLQYHNCNDRELLRIPWVHGSRQTWDKAKHSELFRRWAVYTGRYDPRVADAKRWKANFRCALNSLPDVEEVPSLRKKGQNAYKVYRLKPQQRRESIVIRNNRSRRESASYRSEDGHEMFQYGQQRSPTHTANRPTNFTEELVVNQLFHSPVSPDRIPTTNRISCDSPNDVPSSTINPFSINDASTTCTQVTTPTKDHTYPHVKPTSCTYNTSTIPEPVIQMSDRTNFIQQTETHEATQVIDSTEVMLMDSEPSPVHQHIYEVTQICNSQMSNCHVSGQMSTYITDTQMDNQQEPMIIATHSHDMYESSMEHTPSEEMYFVDGGMYAQDEVLLRVVKEILIHREDVIHDLTYGEVNGMPQYTDLQTVSICQ